MLDMQSGPTATVLSGDECANYIQDSLPANNTLPNSNGLFHKDQSSPNSKKGGTFDNRGEHH